MINFKLKELDKIVPWGQDSELSLNWFGLTDGDLWLTFGNVTIYEYTKEAMDFWGNKPTKYNDYFLSRFIEDFTEIFDKVSETIPQEFYERTSDLKKYRSDAQKWLDKYYADGDEYDDFYFNEYDNLISWTSQRTLDSGHLVGGPHLSFFRRNDKVRIIWQTDYLMENGVKVWTAKDGSIEMKYSEFVEDIKSFADSFFKEMGKQIESAIAKDWGNIKIDKQRLIEEHRERKNAFYASLALLGQEAEGKTNWVEIKQLFERMTNEIVDV